MNVASIFGRLPYMFMSAYSITKFGVEAFSDVLRLEMARFNVNVSIIEPGNFTAATGIMKTGRETSRKFWDELAEPIRKDYGDDSITEVIGGAEWMAAKLSVSNISILNNSSIHVHLTNSNLFLIAL